MSGHQGKEHKELVNISSKKFNASKITIRGSTNITGQYFPDLKTNNTDIECEICPKADSLFKKVRKWNKNRKKILIIGFFNIIYDNFDEVYFYKDEFYKLK